MSGINWSKWSAIAEIISSIAILVTLVFLVVETDQNNDLLEQNTIATMSNGRQNAMQSELDWIYKTLEVPDLYSGELFEVNDGLDRETQIKRRMLAGAMIRMRENSWFQYKIGAIDRDTWEAYMNSFKGFMESDPYARLQWEKHTKQNSIDPEFRKAVEDFIAE